MRWRSKGCRLLLRMTALGYLAALSSACASSSSVNQEPVEDGTYFIRDEDDRVLILRGMNIMSSAKGHPERLPTLTEEDVERYARQWGFNVVRYLIFWDAVEPSPGEYGTEYFDETEQRLDWFANHGVYVISMPVSTVTCRTISPTRGQKWLRVSKATPPCSATTS